MTSAKQQAMITVTDPHFFTEGDPVNHSTTTNNDNIDEDEDKDNDTGGRQEDKNNEDENMLSQKRLSIQSLTLSANNKQRKLKIPLDDINNTANA